MLVTILNRCLPLEMAECSLYGPPMNLNVLIVTLSLVILPTIFQILFNPFGFEDDEENENEEEEEAFTRLSTSNTAEGQMGFSIAELEKLYKT